MDKRLSMDPTMLQQMKSMLGPGGRGGPAPRGGRGGSTQPHQPSGLGSSHSSIGPGGPPGRGRGGIRGLFLFSFIFAPSSKDERGASFFCRFWGGGGGTADSNSPPSRASSSTADTIWGRTKHYWDFIQNIAKCVHCPSSLHTLSFFFTFIKALMPNDRGVCHRYISQTARAGEPLHRERAGSLTSTHTTSLRASTGRE